MCIDFDGHHSGGSSFVYVNDFCYYRNCLYNHRYKFSSEKKKKKTGKESKFGLTPLFRLGEGRGHDTKCH